MQCRNLDLWISGQACMDIATYASDAGPLPGSCGGQGISLLGAVKMWETWNEKADDQIRAWLDARMPGCPFTLFSLRYWPKNLSGTGHLSETTQISREEYPAYDGLRWSQLAACLCRSYAHDILLFSEITFAVYGARAYGASRQGCLALGIRNTRSLPDNHRNTRFENLTINGAEA
ncbi:hypothetical protein BDW62DRAFT_194099 [Aspergillus aurantiobrunneus]